MSEQSFYIHPARTESDIQAIIEMFKAYAISLGIDLTFQAFDEEIKAMPGKYTPPQGELLLARRSDTNEVVGAVGLRPLESPNICEMKRLYIPPAGRGLGTGKALVHATVDVARQQGYKEMRLDTLASMESAQRLYRRAGFVEIEKYYDTPIDETKFMALDLGRG